MRIRRIAILIDGGFFIKRLAKLIGVHASAHETAEWAQKLCQHHVQHLTGEPFESIPSRWLDHVYRLFYYDARPYDGVAHHPVSNQQIQFGKTPAAKFREALFDELRVRWKFALRLGKVTQEDGWHINSTEVTKKLLRTQDWIPVFQSAIDHARTGQPPAPMTLDQADQLEKLADAWKKLGPDDLRLGLRQKGVDMRIGLDISTLTLKKQVDTIILVTGDSDFVPAAKLARREGVEFLLDPLGQAVNADLREHVDGIISGIGHLPSFSAYQA